MLRFARETRLFHAPRTSKVCLKWLMWALKLSHNSPLRDQVNSDLACIIDMEAPILPDAAASREEASTYLFFLVS